jgi:hypothetical protein
MQWRPCWGTHWELEGNIVRTHLEAGKNGKKKNLFPKELITIFGLS